jgi:hypothetical protein
MNDGELKALYQVSYDSGVCKTKNGQWFFLRVVDIISCDQGCCY